MNPKFDMLKITWKKEHGEMGIIWEWGVDGRKLVYA